MASGADIFDVEAARYDAWFDSAEGRVLFENELAAIRLLWRGEFRPALEIGVGTGRFARALGVECGIDPAEGALALASQRGIRVIRANGEELPFPDATFGGVLVIATLCFAADPAALLRESSRVLGPLGKLLVGAIAADSAWGRSCLRKKSEGHPFYRFARFYTVAKMRRLLSGARFVVEAVASTLTQPPDQAARAEIPQARLQDAAGFVCLLGRKRGVRSAKGQTLFSAR